LPQWFVPKPYLHPPCADEFQGYWVCIYIAITIEEQVIFRRTTGYNWATWNDASKLPLGLAGFTAFCAGWGGAAISMNQVYFTGPIAKMVGDEGADVSVSFQFAPIQHC